MIHLLYQFGGSNIGVILVETIIGIIICNIINSKLFNLLSEEGVISPNENRLISLRSAIPTFIIIFLIRLTMGIFGILNDSLLFFAVMATVFFPFCLIFLKLNNSRHKKALDEKSNEDALEIIELRRQYEKKYQKSIPFIIILIWVIFVIIYFPVLGRVQSGVEGYYLTIANFFERSTLSNSTLTIFCLGFEWTFITISVIQGITIMINAVVPIQKRIPKKALNDSIEMAGLIAFGIWSVQLIIFELYLNASINFGYRQDIRLLIVIVTTLYVIFFFWFLKKKYLPVATEKNISKLKVIYDKEQLKSQSVPDETDKIVLEVNDLVTYFYTEEGVVKAVEGVSFKIYEGEVLGLVGETGCGKSVTALSILQLVRSPGKIEGGQVIFVGEDLLQKSESEILEYRGNKITMIFQDPLNSVNPVFKIGDQISEVYLLHKQAELFKAVEINSQEAEKINSRIKAIDGEIVGLIGRKRKISGDIQGGNTDEMDNLQSEKDDLELKLQRLQKLTSIYSVAREWSQKLLSDVEIPDPEQIFDRYPHELSGGMRQRIMIAMALACSPKLLLADEPTTALDVTIQNQILQLMKDLRVKYNTSIMFITHDLGIISKMCDRVAVMYSGFIVEYGNIRKLFKTPYHPYTRGLIASVPVVGDKKEELSIIPGMVPNLIYPPSGCRFHPRCQYCFEPCDSKVPKSIEVEPRYFVACHLYDPEHKDLAEITKKKVESIRI